MSCSGFIEISFLIATSVCLKSMYDRILCGDFSRQFQWVGCSYRSYTVVVFQLERLLYAGYASLSIIEPRSPFVTNLLSVCENKCPGLFV